MAGQEDKKTRVAKVEQFAVCAMRGFGCHKIDMCAGPMVGNWRARYDGRGALPKTTFGIES